MLRVLIAGVCLCWLVPVLAQRAQEKFTVVNYPDPIDRYRACGRVTPSFICDPTNVLPELKANEINEELVNIYNESTVPCYSAGPRATRRRGYIVMVAVMPSMDRFHTVNVSGDYGMELRYMEAQYFAYHLGKDYKWGAHSSQCNEMVIILYSVGDQVLYTSTQSTARRQLTDDIVRDTVLETLTLYYPLNRSPRRAADAIRYMVRKYGVVLREDIARE